MLPARECNRLEIVTLRKPLSTGRRRGSECGFLILPSRNNSLFIIILNGYLILISSQFDVISSQIKRSDDASQNLWWTVRGLILRSWCFLEYHPLSSSVPIKNSGNSEDVINCNQMFHRQSKSASLFDSVLFSKAHLQLKCPFWS